jgi:asparagine synthase (glutamine-hydrolysing)
MCGIAGYVTPGTAAQEPVVRAMCAQIRHRGPDDEGVHLDGPAAIGMRRLSIIDLATGHQPICNEDGTLWIVFNGEIYEYQDLRNSLIARGHQFRTHSDTETLLHLYEEEGPGGLKKVRGMFAYSIWDARKQELFLARDRFGKKPLYYSISRDGLYFASELQCMRAAGVPLEIDTEALRWYFQFSYIPDPWSPYRGVRKLPPGSWLRYRVKDGKVEQGRYWDYPIPAEVAPPGLTETKAIEQVRDLFDEAVRIRMIADVPLGAFLSGGIDSSSVVASMARQSSEPVKTFSIGFDEAAFNELPWAAQVARQYRTEHHEIMVRPNTVELIPRLMRHFGEPFGDSSAIPTYLVSEFARQHVKVVLTGDGGDELFTGYECFFYIDRLRTWDNVPVWMRRGLSAIADRLPYSARGKNYLRMVSRSTPVERYFESNYTPTFLRRQLLAPEWMLPADSAYLQQTLAHCLVPAGARKGEPDILTQALYFETAAKLTGDMLVKVDRMSMAASLEVRCPMLDHHLAELAASLPHEWKMRGGQGKRILLKAVGDRLPPELLTRPKKGFGIPLSIWFRTSLRDFLRDHLLSSSFLNRGIVSPPFVHHLIDEHLSGRRNNQHWLYGLLALELWFRDFDSHRQPAPAAEACSWQQ